jgi:hypothetical protein
MVRDGELAPADAAKHRARNVVTRAIGIATEVQVDHWWINPEPGQIFLMFSDGLHNEVPVPVLEGVLRAASSPQAAVDSLLGIALDAGARDNVSAIAVWVDAVGTDGVDIDEDTAKRGAVDAAFPAAGAAGTSFSSDRATGVADPGSSAVSAPTSSGAQRAPQSGNGAREIEPPPAPPAGSEADAGQDDAATPGLIESVPGAGQAASAAVPADAGPLVTGVPSAPEAAEREHGS